MASATLRAAALVGSTPASTEVNVMPRAGSAMISRTATVPVATIAGRRMTALDSRYQKPEVISRSASSVRRFHALGAAGVDAPPEQREHGRQHQQRDGGRDQRHHHPGEAHGNRKRWGNMPSSGSAAATVIAENSTLLPAV